MASNILASVVLYNPDRNDFLKLLKSLIPSSLEDDLRIDFCFVDNSSNVCDFVKKAVDDFPSNKNLRLFYLHTPKNLGYGGANNFVFNKYDIARENGVKYDYFIIINPDIYFGSDLIKNVVHQMQSVTNGIGLASVKILNPDGSLQYVHRKFPSRFDIFARSVARITGGRMFQNLTQEQEMREHYNNQNGYFNAEMISGCFMVFKSDAFRTIGGFDERFFMYYEDMDISLRCRKLYRNIVFTNLFVYHKWKRGSGKSLKLFVIHLLSFVMYFSKAR
jgi:GT2 family glycosyltransferase